MLFTSDWSGLLTIDSTSVLGSFVLYSLVTASTIVATLLVNDILKETDIDMVKVASGFVGGFSASMLALVLAHVLFGMNDVSV